MPMVKSTVCVILKMFHRSIPLRVRSLYTHAVQSFVWNMMVTERLEKLGDKPVVGMGKYLLYCFCTHHGIVGDLVYAARDALDDEDADNEDAFLSSATASVTYSVAQDGKASDLCNVL